MDALKPRKKNNYEVLSSNDSNDPSYSELSLPYRVICRQRYQKAAKDQRKQFLKEVRLHEMSQLKALDGVRIYREFINPVLRKAEPCEIIKLNRKQQFKLEEILRG